MNKFTSRILYGDTGQLNLQDNDVNLLINVLVPLEGAQELFFLSFFIFFLSGNNTSLLYLCKNVYMKIHEAFFAGPCCSFVIPRVNVSYNGILLNKGRIHICIFGGFISFFFFGGGFFFYSIFITIYKTYYDAYVIFGSC